MLKEYSKPLYKFGSNLNFELNEIQKIYKAYFEICIWAMLFDVRYFISHRNAIEYAPSGSSDFSTKPEFTKYLLKRTYNPELKSSIPRTFITNPSELDDRGRINALSWGLYNLIINIRAEMTKSDRPEHLMKILTPPKFK